MIKFVALLVLIGVTFGAGVAYSSSVRRGIGRFVAKSVIGADQDFDTWLVENSGKYETLPQAIEGYCAGLPEDRRSALRKSMEERYQTYVKALSRLK